MSQDTKIGEKNHDRQAVLLAEYHAAQSSAQHHDQLVWTVSSIVWGGSLALMGFILKDLTLKNPTTDLFVVVSKIFICFLGLILTVFVWFTQRKFRALKKQRYARCKEIEGILKMKLHRATEWNEGSQTDAYSVIMVLFIEAWTFLAVLILRNYL